MAENWVQVGDDPDIIDAEEDEAIELLENVTFYNARYGILVLCLERSKNCSFRTAEKHGILVLDLEHSSYLPHTRNF